ncbi:MAG TPA: ribonuclease HI family protein, partial [Leptospiraceae bacterium]|nr:ribonuclease HI family protein [Leptospiraceae bacterium]
MNLSIYCDGASKGNPGPASIGVFACETEHPEKEIFSISERIENTTNNTAEWTSLIEGIKKAREIGASKIQIFMDSELVVKQVK